eukprot:scaffold237707_cov39-Tisochrysis_lutea.AAC.1
MESDRRDDHDHGNSEGVEQRHRRDLPSTSAKARRSHCHQGREMRAASAADRGGRRSPCSSRQTYVASDCAVGASIPRSASRCDVKPVAVSSSEQTCQPASWRVRERVNRGSRQKGVCDMASRLPPSPLSSPSSLPTRTSTPSPSPSPVRCHWRL